MTDRLYSDPDLVQFYDIENEGGVDFYYCVGFAKHAGCVLDLGCGTGQLAAALADRRSVTGVDPAPAMLDIARRRAGGQRVDWVEADARNVRLGRRFDLVLLTGHAFQVFLTPEDREAVLRTIAAHLAPDGRFIFDTRNPAAEEWLEWTPERSERELSHPGLGTVRAWNDFRHDPATGVVTYSTHYQIPDSGRVLSAESKIAFPTKESLAQMLDQTGLVVEEWLGSWRGEPYAPTSPEIIPIGRLR
ncbi:class I SAM-dependent methyltransferase [Mesorhizobium onobrychidis]|uniref:Methyltransferase domain-containing protein n=1 Tax=Mesorhizobium onobrychidis TaxID=2775404 RepID=A0ABY5R0B6_9HYPH|nr:class I SAM-dependent methyltransferase [Mesorhizobium onobrychidis]UVC16783.1 methyltransferase domain-containing protein [Mesorhizobium onobrychidis]